MRPRTLALISTVVVLGGVVGVVAVSSGSDSQPAPEKKAKGFKPKDIKGKWTGTWTNNAFGSTGDILANVTVKGKKFTPLVDFSGNVLGCPDPPSDTVTLKPGKGNNKWSKKGFKIVTPSQAFGADFQLTYKRKGNKVTASGTSPCEPSIKFTLTGILTKVGFDATVDITSSPHSTATLTASKN
jgi:hypothetical protein